MASPVGLAIRNEKAQVRMNESLAKLAENLGIEVPDQPVRRRDLFLNETFRLEWTADTLELLAGVVSGEIDPEQLTIQESEIETEAAAAENNEEVESSEDSEAASDDVAADDTGASQPHPSEPLDRDELMKLSLDALKSMAADRGIDGVENARAKKDVIEKLVEEAQ